MDENHNLVAITGLDTRKLARHIRDKGATNGILIHSQSQNFDIDGALKKVTCFKGLEGLDLARQVSCINSYEWSEGLWSLKAGSYGNTVSKISRGGD